MHKNSGSVVDVYSDLGHPTRMLRASGVMKTKDGRSCRVPCA